MSDEDLACLCIYWVFGTVMAIPSTAHILKKGIKNFRIKDIVIQLLLFPGALTVYLGALIIYIIDKIETSTVMQYIRKILNKKIFK